MVRLKTLAFLVVIISLLSLRAALAQERQGHWLIGRWDGIIESNPSKGGRNRTLRVIDVAPDNKAQAMFGTGPNNLARAGLMVEGATVKIVTAVKNEVELTRRGDESLVGRFTATKEKREFPISLTKLKASMEFDGEWEGKAYTRPCPQVDAAAFFFRGNYQITIRNSLIKGQGVFYFDNTDSQHIFRWSNITGHVDSDGFGVLVQTPFHLGGASGNLLGAFTGTEFHASQTRGRCAYDVKLMRK